MPKAIPKVKLGPCLTRRLLRHAQRVRRRDQFPTSSTGIRGAIDAELAIDRQQIRKLHPDAYEVWMTGSKTLIRETAEKHDEREDAAAAEHLTLPSGFLPRQYSRRHDGSARPAKKLPESARWTRALNIAAMTAAHDPSLLVDCHGHLRPFGTATGLFYDWTTIDPVTSKPSTFVMTQQNSLQCTLCDTNHVKGHVIFNTKKKGVTGHVGGVCILRYDDMTIVEEKRRWTKELPVVQKPLPMFKGISESDVDDDDEETPQRPSQKRRRRMICCSSESDDEVPPPPPNWAPKQSGGSKRRRIDRRHIVESSDEE